MRCMSEILYNSALPRRKYPRFRDTVILLITPLIECYKYSKICGKELICCLVLLLLTAVLYRIYHGFLTAAKGQWDLAISRTALETLLLNVPDVTGLRSEEVLHLHEAFTAYNGTVAGTEMVLAMGTFCLLTDQCPWNNCKYQRVHGSAPLTSLPAQKATFSGNIWEASSNCPQGSEWLLSGSRWFLLWMTEGSKFDVV